MADGRTMRRMKYHKGTLEPYHLRKTFAKISEKKIACCQVVRDNNILFTDIKGVQHKEPCKSIPKPYVEIDVLQSGGRVQKSLRKLYCNLIKNRVKWAPQLQKNCASKRFFNLF